MPDSESRAARFFPTFKRWFGELTPWFSLSEESEAAARDVGEIAAGIEFRRISTRLTLGVCALLYAGGVAGCWYFLFAIPNTSGSWPMGAFLPRLGLLDAALAVFCYLMGRGAIRRWRGSPHISHDLALTPLPPDTLAWFPVAGLYRFWRIVLFALVPVEACVLLLYSFEFRESLSGDRRAVVFITHLLLMSALAAALAWHHLEMARLALADATINLFSPLRLRGSPQFHRAVNETRLPLCLLYVFLSPFFLPLASAVAYMFCGISCLVIGDIINIEAVESQAAFFAAGTLLVIGAFGWFKRALSTQTMAQFCAESALRQWTGIAESNSEALAHHLTAIGHQRAWILARYRIRAAQRRGPRARWQARLAAARYLYRKAHLMDLDPGSVAVRGWGPWRRADLPPGDPPALEPPEPPLPYDPNPFCPLGTPMGGPSELQSARGSRVTRIPAAEQVSPRARGRINHLYLVWQALCGIVVILSFLALMIYFPYAEKCLDSGFNWPAIKRAALPLLSFSLLPCAAILLGSALRWRIRRAVANRGRTGALFRPGRGDLLVFMEDARSFSRAKASPDDFGFLRVRGEFLEIEALGFRARIHAGDLRLQIQIHSMSSILLLTARFGETLWGISFCRGAALDLFPFPWLQRWRLRRLRRRLRRALGGSGGDFEACVHGG